MILQQTGCAPDSPEILKRGISGLFLFRDRFHICHDKGKKRDNLIWVNIFMQFLMVYVPDGAYDFVWDHITARCVNARITQG